MQAPTLPTELVEIIIASVAVRPHSTPALKACSLASRLFYRLSRKHLLARVTFTVERFSEKRAREFLKIFDSLNTDSVKIPSGIRSLTIRASFPEGQPLETPRRVRGGAAMRLTRVYAEKSGQIVDKVVKKLRNPQKRANTLLPRVFEILSSASLEALTLKNIKEEADLTFAQIAPSLLTTTSLCALHLINLPNFPTSLLASVFYSVPNLREISVIDANVPETANLDDPAHVERFQHCSSPVEELRLGLPSWIAYHRFLETLLAFDMLPATGLSRFPKLQKLTVRTSTTGLPYIWEWIIGGINKHLKMLHFETMHNSDVCAWYSISRTDSYSPFTLDSLPALTNLQIDLYPNDLKEDLSTKQAELVAFLATATKLSFIEMIFIQIILRGPSLDSRTIRKLKTRAKGRSGHPRLPLKLISGAGWLKLDEALTEPAFVRLANVHVHLQLSSHTGDGDESGEMFWSKMSGRRLHYGYPKIDTKVLMPLLANHPFIKLSMTMETQF